MILKVSNPSIENNIQTFLTQQHSASSATLYVKNTAGFTNGDYLVLGKMGEDKSEIVSINAAVSSNTQLSTTATKFVHGTDTPVTWIRYNQVRIYRSTDGGTNYSVLTTISLQADRLITTYDDTSSATTYYYKSTLYNSTVPLESAYSAILPATGYNWYSLISLQGRVLDLFPDPKEEVITRSQITDWMNEEYRKLISLASKVDQGFFLKSNESSPSSLTVDTKLYDLPTDFKSMKKLEIAYDGTNYYRAYPQQIGFGYPSMTYDETNPLYILIANQFELRPTPTSSSGKYKIWYYYIPSPLSSDTDNIDLGLRPHLDALVYHALERAKQKDKKYEDATTWKSQAKEIEELLVSDLMARTTPDRPRWVDITDTTFIDLDDTWLLEL